MSNKDQRCLYLLPCGDRFLFQWRPESWLEVRQEEDHHE
jgi:hypothetical protein